MGITITLHLTYPPDIDEGWDTYQASCGPCSLAAITGSRVMEIRDYLDEGYEQRSYMNPTHMKVALENTVGIRYWTIGARLPKLGLAFIQWGGHEQKPVKVQYRFTHWIAVEGDLVFEVNAPELTTWEEWQRVMPELIRQEGKGNGTFHIRQGIEVRLR